MLLSSLKQIELSTVTAYLIIKFISSFGAIWKEIITRIFKKEAVQSQVDKGHKEDIDESLIRQ